MAKGVDSQGQYGEVLEWYGRALNGEENTYGKGHPSTPTMSAI
jgi:hypothetical protein